MQKWDMLVIDCYKGNVDLSSTSADELKDFAETAINEARKYFSYIVDAGRKIEVSVRSQSRKGHKIELVYFPNTDYVPNSEEAILGSDFRYFLLNLAISRHWLPYPGDGKGMRFIRYNE